MLLFDLNTPVQQANELKVPLLIALQQLLSFRKKFLYSGKSQHTYIHIYLPFLSAIKINSSVQVYD